MKKRSILFLSILVCLISGVQTFAQNGNRPSAGCGPDVPLNLYVNNSGNILPDTQGPMYANGGTKRNQISVVFQVANCSYDLIVQLNNSTRYLVTQIPGQGIYNAKFANFDRIASVPVTVGNDIVMNSFCSSYPQSDNYAGCGVDSLGRRYVRRSVGFDLGDNSHNLRFQYSPIDNPNGNPNVSGTAFIKVFRPDANTWQIMPESSSENTIGEVGVFLTNGLPTAKPIVPFWFTITKQ